MGYRWAGIRLVFGVGQELPGPPASEQKGKSTRTGQKRWRLQQWMEATVLRTQIITEKEPKKRSFLLA